MMPTFLENLRLDELSFVDSPANKAAGVTIFKRADPDNNPLLAPKVEATPKVETAKAKSSKPARDEGEASDRIEDVRPRRFDKFDDAVDALAERLPRYAAMKQARKAHPDLFAAYQAEAIQKSTPLVLEKSGTVLAFEARVDSIQTRDGCSRLSALQKAARAYPQERQAYSTART